MSQHYPKNVTAVMQYCRTCGKMTMHRVDDNRVGTCMETHVFGLSKKQMRQEESKKRMIKTDGQLGLFNEEK